jgi:Ca2+-binding EF-hand superfamily protein
LQFVAEHGSKEGGEKILRDDPKKLMQFFAAMDVDNSGTIDFHEFSVRSLLVSNFSLP